MYSFNDVLVHFANRPGIQANLRARAKEQGFHEAKLTELRSPSLHAALAGHISFFDREYDEEIITELEQIAESKNQPLWER